MRTVLAVIAGYAVMVIFVMTAFTLAYMAGGADFAFRSGTLDVTVGWLLMATLCNFVAACLGGWIASVIAREKGAVAVKALAGVLLVLGMAIAVWNLMADRPAPSKAIAQLSSSEAAKYARQPSWYEFLIPLIGAAGVLIGGRGRGADLVSTPSTTAEIH